MQVPVLRLEVTGEAAMACYFLMANCDPRVASPSLDTESNPLAIVFRLESPAVVTAIRDTLDRAQSLPGSIATSARALTDVVGAKLKDVCIPDNPDLGTAGQAG